MKKQDYFITLHKDGTWINIQALSKPHINNIYINKTGLATIFYDDPYQRSGYIRACTDGFEYISIEELT
jgi:hypothetical protein